LWKNKKPSKGPVKFWGRGKYEKEKKKTPPPPPPTTRTTQYATPIQPQLLTSATTSGFINYKTLSSTSAAATGISKRSK